MHTHKATLFTLLCLILSELSLCNERTALEELFVSTSGLGWIRKRGWLTNETICDWEGVECGGGKVVTLDLAVNNLVGYLPMSMLWSQLGDLTRLNVSYNGLGGNVTNELSSVGHQVAMLDITGNNFTGFIEATNSQLCHLRKAPLQLYVSSNKLTSIFSLGIPTCISTIEAAANMLAALPDLSSTTALTALDVSSNDIIDDSGWVRDLCRSVGLQKIVVDGNENLGGMLDACVETLTDLRVLSIRNTEMTGFVPNVSRLTNLQELRLAASKFSGSIPDEFSALKGLQVVELHGPFDGPLPTSLFTPYPPPTLILSENKLTGTVPSPAANFTVLKLSENALHGGVPKDIFAGTAKELNLHSNRFTGTIPGWELSGRTNDVSLVSVTFYDNLFSGFVADFYAQYSSITWMATLDTRKLFFSGLDLLYPVQPWVQTNLGGSQGRNITVSGVTPGLWKRNETAVDIEIVGSLAYVDPAVIKINVSGELFNVAATTGTKYTAVIDVPEEIGQVEVSILYTDPSVGINHVLYIDTQDVVVYDPYPVVVSTEPKYFRSQGCERITVTGENFSPTGGSLICSATSTETGVSYTFSAVYVNATQVICRIPFQNHTYELDTPYNITISADNGSSWSHAPTGDAYIMFYSGCHLTPASPGATCDDGCGFCQCYGPQAGTCSRIPGQPSTCACHTGFSGYNCGVCAEGYFGIDCTKCQNCHSGTCDDGGGPQCRDVSCELGDGTCACEPLWEGTTCKKLKPFIVTVISVMVGCALVAIFFVYRKWSTARRRRAYEAIQAADRRERQIRRQQRKEAAMAVNKETLSP